MYKETLLKIALMLAKFFVAMMLILIGAYLLEVPPIEDFVQFLKHVLGIMLIYYGMDIDWNVK